MWTYKHYNFQETAYIVYCTQSAFFLKENIEGFYFIKSPLVVMETPKAGYLKIGGENIGHFPLK